MTELLLIERALASAETACFSCSFQAEDIVVLHLLQQARPEIPVLFLDTGYHFADILRYRDELAASWGVNLANVTSRISREQQECRLGERYRLRREQSPTRADLRILEILYPPLYDHGYTSIGCEPFTTPPSDSANVRSGRWGGARFEGGIHIFATRS